MKSAVDQPLTQPTRRSTNRRKQEAEKYTESTFLCKSLIINGGRGGIRTHGEVTPTPDFESGAFNHSATLPTVYYQPLAAPPFTLIFPLYPAFVSRNFGL